MKSFDDVRAYQEGHGSTWIISLSRLLGQGVKDVNLTVDSSSGEPCFMARCIVLEDGTTVGLQGEHDEVYIEDYRDRPGFAPEQAEALYKELNGDDE